MYRQLRREPLRAENANATTCYGSQKPDPARGRVKLAPQTVQVHRTLERQPRAADPRVGADWVRRAPAGADGSHLAGQSRGRSVQPTRAEDALRVTASGTRGFGTHAGTLASQTHPQFSVFLLSPAGEKLAFCGVGLAPPPPTSRSTIRLLSLKASVPLARQVPRGRDWQQGSSGWISDCANFLAVCFWSSDLIPLSPSLHLQRGKLILSRTSVWVEGQACAQGTGCTDAWHARARSLQSLVPCARRFAAWRAVQREPAEPRDPSRVG